MDISRIFNTIDGLNDRYVDVWEDICNIESPSDCKEGVDAVSSYFIKLVEKKGWRIERFPEERFGDVVCITMNPDSDKDPIALSGHIDTVHPVGLFGTPAARREGDRLYGPGAMDCKGGVVAGFLAMHALDECGYSDRPIMMLLQSNEEIGSGLDKKGPIRRICEQAKNSVAFLNLDKEAYKLCPRRMQTSYNPQNERLGRRRIYPHRLCGKHCIRNGNREELSTLCRKQRASPPSS